MILIFGSSGFIGSNFCKKIYIDDIPAIALGTKDKFLESFLKGVTSKKYI